MDNVKLPIQSLDQAAEHLRTDVDRVFRAYRSCKKSDIRKTPCNLGDRHRYFEKMDREKIAAAKRIVLDDFLTDREKCTLIPKALGLKFELKLDNSLLVSEKGRKLHSFELINTEYDCFIYGDGDDFFERVYTYFINMLNLNHLR